MTGTYRYDVLVCLNIDRTPGAHDGACMFRFECAYWGAAFRKAFDQALGHPHSVVMSARGNAMAFRRSFEHVDGGGPCTCGSGRGPLVVTAGGEDRFMCDRCCRQWISWEWQWSKDRGIAPSEYLYRPRYPGPLYN